MIVRGNRILATSSPDVFIAEIDTVFDGNGEDVPVSLVQIFRIRDGKIA
ncbi:hypothetical protein ACGFYQ_32590 [Streptomyces sp. NPDC048258]